LDISLGILRKLCHDETMLLTQHLTNRCRERNIRLDDIQHAIRAGEIIEQYPDDFPHPSCLVLGSSCAGKALHVVVGIASEHLWVITAYFPTSNHWESDHKTRKAGKKT